MVEIFSWTLTLEQLYLLIFLVLYFGLILGLRSLILYLRTGISPLQKFGRKSNHHLAERLIPMAVCLLLIIAGNYFFMEENIKYLIPFTFLDSLWIKHVGLGLSVLGLVTTFIAQLQMRDSWRIGLDKKNSFELVDEGMFAYTRNPIYVALMMAYLGVFLIIPGLVSLLFMLTMAVAMNLKARDEELFLEEKLGIPYLNYKKKVRRWL